MKPRSGIIFIRFGHEACGKAVATRQPLDQHLEQPGIIGGAKRIVAMHQVDLELAQARLGNCRVSGDVHFLAGIIKIGKEFVELIQRPN